VKSTGFLREKNGECAACFFKKNPYVCLLKKNKMGGL
jgi:hypothetical protein